MVINPTAPSDCDDAASCRKLQVLCFSALSCFEPAPLSVQALALSDHELDLVTGALRNHICCFEFATICSCGVKRDQSAVLDFEICSFEVWCGWRSRQLSSTRYLLGALLASARKVSKGCNTECSPVKAIKALHSRFVAFCSDLREHFGPFGVVPSVRLAYDHSTGRRRGFA